MHHLSISLLGRFRVTLDDLPLSGWESEKVRALLAVLCLEASHPHRRSRLAGLLWPDLPEKRARRNLSQSLYNLRQVLHDQDEPSFILASTLEVQWNPEGNYWLDVAAVRHILEHPDAPPAALAQAVAWYRGDLLAAVTLPDNPLWEEWVAIRQEALRRQVAQACDGLAGHFAAERQYDEAIQYARREVELSPWQERAHLRLIHLLAESGQVGAALRQYEHCCRLLAEEFGVAPSEELRDLAERLRGNLSPAPAVPLPVTSMPPHSLPPAGTRLVGREEAVAEVVSLLRQADCRLLTILGTGGVGKTRLALQVARELLPHTRDGAFWAPLDAIHDVEQLAAAIWRALPIEESAREKVVDQLHRFFEKRQALLVLDNFEHLVPGAPLLSGLLAAAPGLKVLVTSRVALGLMEEWRWTLGGLRAPEADTPLGELMDFSAVQLWVQRATQADGGWKLEPENAAAVRRICATVEGLPLGLELAAAWVRAMPAAEIADALVESVDLLATTRPDIPERQRSIAAMFEHSWRLLGAEEQRAFRALSVFEGDFRREAAQAVAGANPALLLSLSYQSLLRLSPAGRYALHPLLAELAAAKLVEHPTEAGAARARHARYFIEWTARQGRDLATTNLLDWTLVAQELKNIQTAWLWAAHHGEVDLLEGVLPTLSRYYTLRGPYEEGERLFRSALDAVTGAAAVDPFRRVRVAARLRVEQARLLNARARYDEAATLASEVAGNAALPADILAAAWLEWGVALISQGVYEEGQATLEEALRRGEAVGDAGIMATVLRLLGVAASRRGDTEAAQRYFERGLLLSRQARDREAEAGLLNNLGIVAKNRGDLARARDFFEQALQCFQEIGNRRGESIALNNLGSICRGTGDYEAARGFFQQALQLKRDMGDRHGASLALNNLGNIAAELGQYPAARLYFRKALALHRELGQRREEALGLSNLALLLHLMGDDEGARAYAEEALLIARALDDQETEAFALTHLGHALLALGQPAAAGASYEQAVALRQASGARHLAMESLAGLVRVACATGDVERAVAPAEEILAFADARSLHGTEEPLRILLSCYRAFALSNGRADARQTGTCRAADVLQRAHDELQRRAACLTSEATRRTFLDVVPTHRAIIAAWKAHALSCHACDCRLAS